MIREAWNDRIRLTWPNAFEAFYMSLGGIAIAALILAIIIWMVN